MNQKPWTLFFLETNQYSGPVSSYEEWVKVLSMHGTLLKGDVSVLTRAKHMPGKESIYGMPKFDLKPFKFDTTAESARTLLYTWAEGQGMDLAA